MGTDLCLSNLCNLDKFAETCLIQFLSYFKNETMLNEGSMNRNSKNKKSSMLMQTTKTALNVSKDI